MNSFIGNVVLFLIREGEHHGFMLDLLPKEKNTFLIKVLRELGVGKLFSKYVDGLSYQKKNDLYYTLINKYRIPIALVPSRSLEEKYIESLNYLLKNSSPKDLGDYLEFGVFQGASMICMHKALKQLNLNQVRMFGFDSFEGLPDVDDGEMRWTPGQFRSEYEFTIDRLKQEEVDFDRTILTKGFFSDTWNKEFIEKHNIKKVSVIMLDCDLYSSSKEALDLCIPLIRDEAIIVFDDWGDADAANEGQQLLFREFVQGNPQFKLMERETYGQNTKMFLVQKVKVKGVSLSAN
ncbi:TylF/MycF/NovP-related O-methyltransferase [Planctomycetota bacterium]